MFSADLGGYTPSLPAATDPPFQKVALLLHGDGTNGAQNNTFVDYSYPGGYAVSFDGTNSTNLLLGGQSAFSFNADFTIELWFNAFGAGQGTPKLYESRGGGQEGAYPTIEHSGTSLVFRMDSAARITTTFSYNTWNHVAVVRSGTTITMYLNGTSVGTYTKSGTTLIGANRPCIGAYPNFDGFNGLMSNLRVVKGTALYTSNFTPSNQPLTAVSGTQLLTCQSATIVDNSPNAFTITVNGNAAAVSSKTITRTGNVAQGTFSPFSLADGQWSNYFDGSGDYLTTPYSTTAFDWWTSDFTLEAWVYPTTLTGWGYLDGPYAVPRMIGNSAYNGTTSYWSFGPYTDGTVIFRYWNGSATNAVISTQTVSINTWNHIAVTKTASGIIIWVNGVGTTATAISGTPVSSTSYPLIIGQINNTSITGYLSNLRIVKGTAVYTSNFTPPTASLTAITNTSLLTCQSNRFKDNSSNNFTITRNGDTKVTAFSPFAPSAAYSASTNGGSGYFDGSGDYLSFSNITFNGDFCAECWFYNQNTSYSVLFGNGSVSGDNNHQFRVSGSGGVELILSGNTIVNVSVTAVALNSWSHIAFVRQGANCAVFVNGVRQGTGTSSINTSICNRFGDIANFGGFQAKGFISNARIVIGSSVYDPTVTTLTIPTTPLTAITNTQLLLNCTNAGIIDNAGKNDIETVGNAQISTSVKKYGTGSMYFDGTGDWLAIPSSTEFDVDGGDFTIECWVYASSTQPAYAGLVSRQGSGGVQIIMGSGGTTVEAWGNLPVGTRLAASTTTVTNSNWHHIALVRNGSLFKIYVDGVAGSTTLTSSSAFVAGAAPLYIGYDTGGSGRVFNGYIDDLRITKGQALYTSNFTPPTQAFPNV